MSIANKLGLGARIVAVLAVKGATAVKHGVTVTVRDVKLGLQGKQIVTPKRVRKQRTA